MTMIQTACQAACDSIVDILKQLAATMIYKANFYKTKMRGILKTWNDKELIATFKFMLSSAFLEIWLWTMRTDRSCLSFKIP